MSRSHDAPTRNRSEAYFTASFEVARRLADGRGEEAVEILRRELDRLGTAEGTVAGRRFLLSQIALCYARMDDLDSTRKTLEEIEDTLPRVPETAVLLAEGYLLLVGSGERAAHHAGLALKWADEVEDIDVEVTSGGHNLLARAFVSEGDLVGAFGAWRAAPLPGWQVATELLEAGYDPSAIRDVLSDALPRIVGHERARGSYAQAASDRIRRLVAWIDAGCPKPE
jgi:hypothetical protein